MSDYVTVMDAAPRSGWKAARRTGDIIEFVRLPSAAKYDSEAARAEAAAMFPGVRVVLPNDEFKPWQHRDIGIAEHGARKGTLFARCACTWSGPPRRSLEAAAADLTAHLNPPQEK